MSVFDKLKKDIKEDIKNVEFANTQIEDDDELESVKEQAIEFYNKNSKTEDVFRHEGTCVFLVHTPERQVDEDGKAENTFQVFQSQWGDKEKQYLLPGTTFRIHGETRFLSIFATKEQWKEIAGTSNSFYDKNVLLTGNLKKKYKLLSEAKNKEIKPAKLSAFLKQQNIKKLEELDESDYIIYYATNPFQILESA